MPPVIENIFSSSCIEILQEEQLNNFEKLEGKLNEQSDRLSVVHNHINMLAAKQAAEFEQQGQKIDTLAKIQGSAFVKRQADQHKQLQELNEKTRLHG